MNTFPGSVFNIQLRIMEMERQKGMIEFRMKTEFGKNEFHESDDDGCRFCKFFFFSAQGFVSGVIVQRQWW